VSNRAVFLDRDGTLNIDKGYVHRIEDWEWIPGAMEAMVALKNAGFLLIVITNQAGIARGYYDENAMNIMHSKVNEELKSHGATIDGFYHCPHHPDFSGACECRKPNPGLLFKAMRDFDIDRNHSWMIGDKASDIQAGLSAGVSPILILTGYGQTESTQVKNDVIRCEDIHAASHYIITHIAL